jgi:hypothetical protein
MGANQRAIEHQILVPSIGRQDLEDALPNASLGSAGEALVDALPFALALRQIVPMRARAQHPKTAVHEQPVIRRRPARIGLLARQKLANPIPLRIRQLVSLDHHPAANHMIPSKMNQHSSGLRILNVDWP